MTETEPYYYLAGPMTGIPSFNIPEFDRIAQNLRNDFWHIVSPAELDDPEVRASSMASPDGAAETSGSEWNTFLRRDVNIVMHPACMGVICIEGWEGSKGARLETFVAQEFGLGLWRYRDRDDGYDLLPLDRDAELRAYDLMERFVRNAVHPA